MTKRRRPSNPQPVRPVAAALLQPAPAAQVDAARFDAAVAMHRHGRLDDAQAIYAEILQSHPTHLDALQLLAMIAVQRNEFSTVVELLDRILDLKPDLPQVLNNRGNALFSLKRLDDAVDSYDRALRLRPDYTDALANRGKALTGLERLVEALDSYDRALKLEPGRAEVHCARGSLLTRLHRNAEALDSQDRALAIKPVYAEALCGRGNALALMESIEEALRCFDRALQINPDFPEALCGRGNALAALDRSGEALNSYDRALAINPAFAEAHCNRGIALGLLNRPEEALESYARALDINPAHAEAFGNRGNALTALRRNEEALECYERALNLRPDYVDALCNRSQALMNLKRNEEALESCQRALGLKPDLASAFNYIGLALANLKRLDESAESYGRAFALKPDFEFLHGAWLYARLRICDWSNLQSDSLALANSVSQGKKAAHPFHVSALSDSPILQHRAAKLHVQWHHPASHLLPAIPRRPGHQKIRIGYFSADFRIHPVSILTAGLFEAHDKSRFELTAFSLGPDTRDALRVRLEAGFETFIDVRNLSDKEVAVLARNLEIDIAVDLGGFTEGSRTNIFALRAAPLQLGYLGYLGTSGAAYFDYLIADRTIVPNEYREHYAEKIVYLPSFQVNDAKRPISERTFTREELGLPETGFVFCCFNNNYKITPRTFDIWMRILEQVKGSTLWLLADNAWAAGNLKNEAAVRGIDADRLVFGGRIPGPEYLARYRTADLFLDTLPYNAGTTASDALWAGLPVLTCTGDGFASRVAASVLNAIELPELVTETYEEYEALAIELANEPDRLGVIRKKLEVNRLSAPLFDTRLFARHIEDGFMKIYERHQADLPPEHVYISS